MRITTPSTVLEPGTYPASFTIDGHQVSGSVEFAPMKLPTADLVGEGSESRGGFPKEKRADRLVGRLDTKYDVIFYNIVINEFVPDRYTVIAGYALVGIGLIDAEDSLRESELQIEGLDEFIANPPLGNWTWPKPGNPRFDIPINGLDPITWKSEGIVVECAYHWEVNDGNGYQFNASFRPALRITCPDPLEAREWLTDWVIPLYQLFSLDMHKPCPPSWVVLGNGEELPGSVRAQLFGGGITQNPYLATRPKTILGEEHWPLFTARELPTQLPGFIRNWRELYNSDNPFPELFGLASGPDLPDRAKFLYLVQALEALHNYDHREDNEKRKAEHKSTRAALLDKIREKLDKEDCRIARRIISTRPIEGLDQKIKDICANTPSAVVERLAYNSEDPIVLHYPPEGKESSFQEIVRRLRNDLSHGNYNPPDHELSPWTRRLERLSQAQALWLLGFDSGHIGARLGNIGPLSS